MRIIRTKDYDDFSRKGALIMASHISLNPTCTLGLATGSTPVGIYKNLVEMYKKGDLDFSNISSVNLDEYVGLAGDHPQSYRYFMDTNLFNHVNINKENTQVPNGLAKDMQTECKRYDEVIAKANGVQVQILGIGLTGHIGFNEPAELFEKGTHCVELAEETVKANSRFFTADEKMPTHALSMGIKTIMQTKNILLCASGKEKAEILHKALFGPITPQVTGSILQLHPSVVVVADEAALSACSDKEINSL